MDSHKALVELLESSNEPEGITVQAADGRLFFLTKTDAERMAIPENKLLRAFRSIPGSTPKPGGRPMQQDPCASAWEWLETHSPHSERWRAVCLAYFYDCV